MKLIGKGKTGKAYLLDNGNVLKITSDKDEFKMALKIIEEKPRWASLVIRAEKKNNKYQIEKSLVSPIFPKAGKNDSMNYGDARFEFTGYQFLPYPNSKIKMEKIASLLGAKMRIQGTVCTVNYAISP